MATFDEKKFNDLLKSYYEFVSTHKYYYLDWRTNSSNALNCKEILNKIVSQLKNIINDNDINEGKNYTIKVSSGASYFPRLPWIGVFFDNEKPTNGVYPVLGFYGDNDGFFVGCTESISNVQPNFSKKFHNKESFPEYSKQWEDMGFKNNNHIALPFTIFKKNDWIDSYSLVNAFKSAFDIYRDYRNENKYGITDSGWYESKEVNNVYKWLEEFCNLDDLQYVFRGQGFDCWSIESSLGVKAEYNSIHLTDGGRGLREKERQAINEFSREVKRTIFSNGELCEVDIVSLMQHYGSSTRLVDFSYSPMVALFWAWEQYKHNTSNFYACLNMVNSNFKNKVKIETNPCIWAIRLESVLQEYSGDILLDKIQKSTENANKILKGKAKNISPGVDIVVPRINNERISSQDGLFLMARDIGMPFENNLKATLAYNGNLQNCASPNIIKYVFTKKAQEQIDNFLLNTNVSYKILYPDLTGLAKSVTARIMSRK